MKNYNEQLQRTITMNNYNEQLQRTITPYKLLLNAFKDLHGLTPSYLGELIHFYKPARSLRTQSAALIEMPKNARTKIYGERRFDVADGTLWNSLPASLRNEQSLEAFKRLIYSKSLL